MSVSLSIFDKRKIWKLFVIVFSPLLDRFTMSSVLQLCLRISKTDLLRHLHSLGQLFVLKLHPFGLLKREYLECLLP